VLCWLKTCHHEWGNGTLPLRMEMGEKYINNHPHERTLYRNRTGNLWIQSPMRSPLRQGARAALVYYCCDSDDLKPVSCDDSEDQCRIQVFLKVVKRLRGTSRISSTATGPCHNSHKPWQVQRQTPDTPRHKHAIIATVSMCRCSET
jgi:hypothetical protein